MRENCWNKLTGRKVSTLYREVRTLLCAGPVRGPIPNPASQRRKRNLWACSDTRVEISNGCHDCCLPN